MSLLESEFWGLTAEQISKIEKDFASSVAISGKQGLEKVLETCTGQERLLLKFLYAYMPASDIATYDADIFLKHIRDTLAIKQQIPWCNELTGEFFLNYILPLRINNEDLTDHRKSFFEEIYPRVKDLSMAEAVLEVNYWCFEKATYKSTDIRTLSPLSIIRNAFGRCGEESVLCVAALRSVGIPARQCYTPRWAHCDDNHAWVEVWTGKQWHFIGACEPEPVLDSGWFAEPAHRGMLIHARAFSGLVSENDITNQTPIMTQINILDNYSDTKKLEVIVQDGQGKPIEGAEVRFELINYAEFFPLATIFTDANGHANLKTGFGDLNIHVSKDGRFIHKKADRNCKMLSFSMDEAILEDAEDFIYDQIPPALSNIPSPAITDEMTVLHKKKNKNALEKRKSYEGTFLQGETVSSYAAQYGEFSGKVAEFVALSNGNHPEIAHFLETGDIPVKYKVMLLESLRAKDLSDTNSATLESHLQQAYGFHDCYEDETYQKYILCPRIGFEMITDYREFINDYFNNDKKAEFQKDPISIYHYIEQNVKDCGDRDYATVSASPKGLLKLGYGSELSRKILFVAICRTLGIPARLNGIDHKLEYIIDKNWVTVDSKGIQSPGRTCVLKVKNAEAGVELSYHKHFSVARLTDGVYRTLGLRSVPLENDMASYQVEEGFYRILTTNRLRDGSVLAEAKHIKLSSGQTKEVIIKLRQPDMETHTAVELPEIPVLVQEGKTISAQKLAEGKASVIAFIETGKEPTEHLLNEILEQVEGFKKVVDRFFLVLDNPNSLKDRLLEKTLEKTGITTVFRVNNGLEAVAEKLGMQSIKFPLILGLDATGGCVFDISGYNVGTGDMLLNYFNSK